MSKKSMGRYIAQLRQELKEKDELIKSLLARNENGMSYSSSYLTDSRARLLSERNKDHATNRIYVIAEVSTDAIDDILEGLYYATAKERKRMVENVRKYAEAWDKNAELFYRIFKGKL